jgi:hypothetical protein
MITIVHFQGPVKQAVRDSFGHDYSLQHAKGARLRRAICPLHFSIFDFQLFYESDGSTRPAAASPRD